MARVLSAPVESRVTVEPRSFVPMAWLQRIVNGGGYVDREYGVGRGRIDLLLRWPWEGDGTRRL